MKKPAETVYVVYVFTNGRWQGILMAADVIEGGGKAKIEEFPQRKKD